MFEYQNKKIHNKVQAIDIQSEEHHILTGKKMRDRRMKDRRTVCSCIILLLTTAQLKIKVKWTTTQLNNLKVVSLKMT